MTDALMLIESVNTNTISTWGRVAQIHLDVAPFTSEATGTVTAEVIHKISAIGVQETRNVGTVVNVGLTESTLPSRLTLTAEASLF